MTRQAVAATAGISPGAESHVIARFAREASIEISVQDVKYLERSRAFLAPGTTVYVSHLPGQAWEDTAAACGAVRAAGYDPVPHVPVRLIPDARALDQMLARFVAAGDVREVLLISGDYARAVGPYTEVATVLRDGALQRRGLQKVSIAGHPEGHPKVPRGVIRRAESEKVLLATEGGLSVTLVTQFIFEPAPVLEWMRELRAAGVRARVVAGLAGPAGLATLFKFAIRCGVGPSIRALGARPSSLMSLVGEHGPEGVLRGLARAYGAGQCELSGIHLFCFGGYLRTCEWLNEVAGGRFRLNVKGAFDLEVGG